MNIREARTQDLETLLAFEQHVVDEERPYNPVIRPSGVTYYDLQALITEARSLLLVAETEGRIVASGYVQIRPSSPNFTHEQHGYLGFMYVEPEFRGRGLNGELCASLINWSKEQGVTALYLDVYAGNQAAVRAYEKAGFTHNLIEMQLLLKPDQN